MALPKAKDEKSIKTRTPQKKTQGSIFDNLRSLPHPVEEILGIEPLKIVSQIQSTNSIPQRSTVSESDTTPLSDTVSESDTVSKIAPVRKTLQSLDTTLYLPDTVPEPDTVSKSNTVSTYAPNFALGTGFLDVPHYISDVLAPSLKPAEWTVYFQLYRLSHGWGRDECLIGYKRLTERTNIKKTALRETLESLINQGLVEEIEVINSKDIKGTRYRVHTGRLGDTVSESDIVSPSKTVSQSGTNKRHDHDLVKKDHHQAQSAIENEEISKQKETMMIYEKLTGKKFNQADETHFKKICHLELEEIASLMQIVHQRASQPIGSFAYFAKGILSETETAGKGIDSNAKLRSAYGKIIGEIKSLYIGGNLPLSELIYKIKTKGIRDGLTWNDDIVNELMGI